ncbi:hypothetical protein ASG31_08310 [Chryseobacterium sp. Leaf404]|uniref:conserved phage C-terminal domain-containing protein n=1 Tax=unclassified Chryseobacterium TaxID=2593645 RepID=UPI0006F7B839|nr:MULTISPECIES: conserved phage C-terminal domain-containing protein [unclassified Chryseobacterium]KQT17404.1 hypothetical protein ASG31_08310 [Chryseobacterium sp. Leaf404]
MEETEILNFLNEVTGSKFREIKSNISKISALLKQNFTKEQIIEVIQLKVIQWKNNPKMAMYLRPSTLFLERNFENYINEIERIKQNPQLYAKYFAEINNVKTEQSTSGAFDKIDAMFGKRG